ncbi:hypothetical protein KCM76_24970 [Zooshikella marina]|uniref:hypothetical protein n=1 Tax=Zooshikella ganghwensis TaxID=202772 RepID=UPI001BAF7A6A|nr:hypothetical protein [Zooshikella ganghwensis]MBU2709272.1 hypothetical protein [Zooshikella ganghwensis]
MDSDLVASVEFELFPASINGKTRGYWSGVRPNHFIEELGCSVIGSVDFEGGSVDIGETKKAVISYIYWEPFEKVLKPGLEYEVQEGSKVVGRVRVLEVG